MSHSYKDLIVWPRAKGLAGDVCRAAEAFLRKETYGLISPSRRAAKSVVSNIAEAQGRLTKAEFQQFLGQPRGSLLELETQLAMAVDFDDRGPSELTRLEAKTSEVGRRLNGLIESLRTRSKTACS